MTTEPGQPITREHGKISMASGNRRHKWDENDDLVALYLYRTQWDNAVDPPQNLAEIANSLGISEASLISRRANFAHLDGKSGLSHVAKQSVSVHERHRKTSNAGMRLMVLRALEGKTQ
jgi:hypothetical protein